MKKVRQKDGLVDETNLFDIRYPVASKKEVISRAEVDGLVEWAKTILVGKSGSSSELYVCNLTKQKFHEEYLQALPKVMQYILASDMKLSHITGEAKNKFEKNVQIFNRWKINKGGPFHLTGRCYEKFLDILRSRLRISFKPHPKLCKHCADHNKIEAAYTKAVQALSRDVQSVHLREVVSEKERELNASLLHKKQVQV